MKKSLVLLLVLGVVAAGTTLGSATPRDTGRPPSTNWLQYRGRQQRAGSNSSETQLTPATVGGLEIDAIAGFTFDGPTPPLVYNNKLYTVARSFWDDRRDRDVTTIYALNALTGRKTWTLAVSCKPISGVPAISAKDGVLIVPLRRGCGSQTGSGALMGVDLTTHKEIWRGSYGRNGTPAVVGGTVYIDMEDQGSDGLIASIEARTGEANWTTDGSFGTVAVGGGIVYSREQFELGAPKLTALDAHTGDRLWSRGVATGNPAISGGRVYVPCDIGLCSYNRAGTSRWSFPGSGEVTIGQGMVFVGCNASDLCALDARTGNLRWTTPLPGASFETANVAGGVLYAQLTLDVDSRGYLWLFDAATGESLGSVGDITNQTAVFNDLPVNNTVVTNAKVYLILENRLYIYGLPTF